MHRKVALVIDHVKLRSVSGNANIVFYGTHKQRHVLNVVLQQHSLLLMFERPQDWLTWCLLVDESTGLL